MNRRTGFSLALAAILLCFSLFSFAQDRDDYDQDPPSRAGRVGYTQGTVSFQPGGEGDWLDAVPNRPLTSGDNLWSDRGARAEVQVGSTSVRLGSETSVTLLDLESNVTQLRLSMGTLFFRVRHVGSDETFEVDTPNLAFNVTEPGQYRIDVNENGDQTTATVWRGGAEITGGGSSYRLGDGQLVLINCATTWPRSAAMTISHAGVWIATGDWIGAAVLSTSPTK
jgi:ferric-dicitrate binding protein FerR (iron transport regulator)